MYKLFKAQKGVYPGNKVRGFNNLYYKNPTTVQQPQVDTEIDEDDVISDVKQGAKQLVTKGKNWLNERQERMQDKRDERNAPYQEQLDAIDESKSNIKDYRGQLKELRKNNRLSDKVSNKKLKENRLLNKLSNAQLLDPERDEQRGENYDYDLMNQEYNQGVKHNRQQGRLLRNNAVQDRRNSENETKAETRFLNSRLNQALKTGDYETAQALKERENIEDIQKRASERQYNILQRDKNRDAKLEKRKLSPFSEIEKDGVIIPVDNNYFNYDFKEPISIGGKHYFPTSENLNYTNQLDLDDENYDYAIDLTRQPYKKEEIDEDNVLDKVPQEYTDAFNNANRINNFKSSILQHKNIEYQDGGYLNESDFDYTEDIDLNELNRYLRGGMLPKAQDGKIVETIGTADDLRKKMTTGIDYNKFDIGANNAINEQQRKSQLSNDSFARQMSYLNPKEYEWKLPETEYRREGERSNIFGTPFDYNETTDELGIKSYNNVNDAPVKNDPTKIVTNKSTNTSTASSEYDPWQLREPGNIIQQRANLGPMMYNAGRFLDRIDKTQTYHTDPTLRRESVTPDYTAANEAANATAAALRENSRSPQGFLATSISANMNLAKQKNAIANDATKQNIQYRQNYLGQVNANKAVKDQKQQAAYQQDQRNKVARDEYGVSFVEDVRKYQQDKGKFLNKEREDRIRRDTYLNKIAKDYQFKELPNGDYEIVMNGRKMTMSPEMLEKTIEDDKAKAQAKTNADIKAKEDANTAELAKLKKEKEELEAAKNKPSGAGAGAGGGNPITKKFGGWLKEQSQHTKKRNRLYL